MKVQEKIEMLDTAALTADPRNARLHNRRNLEAIKASLLRFGQQKPIVVDGDGIVRAGNGTLAAARELGWEKILTIKTALTGEEAIAFGIADNRSNELSGWDDDMLADLLTGMEDKTLIDIAGFDQIEMNEMFGDDHAKAPEHRAMSMTKASKDSSVRIVIFVSDVATVERALYLTGCDNRATALLTICEFYEKRQQHDQA